MNAPHVGMDLKKDPRMLASPRAIISCVASTIFPDAVEISKLSTNSLNQNFDSLNDFAIAMLAMIDTKGRSATPDPRSLTISMNS